MLWKRERSRNARRPQRPTFRPRFEGLEPRLMLASPEPFERTLSILPDSEPPLVTTVATDKPDYAPGATAIFTASGFEPGSTLRFDVRDDPSDPGDDGDADVYDPIVVTDGSPEDLDGAMDGQVMTGWLVPAQTDPEVPADAYHATLLLDVVGTGSDLVFNTQDDQHAATTFTDAGPEANITFSTDFISERAQFGFGKAIDLDGVDDYVSLASGESHFDAITDAITVEAWIKSDPSNNSREGIVTKGYSAWSLLCAAGDGVTFRMGGSDLTGTADIDDGNWHHVAGVFTAGITGGADAMFLYVDGELDASQSRALATVPDNGIDLQFGSTVETTPKYFDGLIDDVRIWNTARSQTEIWQNMSQPLSGSESGLVAYYTFDDETATDQGANGIDGVLVGDPSFDVSEPPSIIGYAEVTLSEPVTASPGMILNYEISAGSTATEGVDFYASQLDVSTTDLTPPTNSVFIAQGEYTARIYIAALPDAVDEVTEDVVITLLPGLQSNLVSYWTFDDTLADDPTLGNGNDGTISTGSATYAAGMFGAGIDLPGTGNQHVIIPEDDGDFDFAAAGNGLTVSAWIRVDDFNKTRQTVLAKGESDKFRINRSGTTDKMKYHGAGTGSALESTVNVNDGLWRHVVAVTEIGGESTRFYVDGSANGVTLSDWGTSLADNDLNLLIGNNPESTNRGWNGMIDDVAIWGRPLTDAEVDTIYNDGTGQAIGSLWTDYYTVGTNSSATIEIHDADTHTAGIALTNSFGEDATGVGLVAAENGTVGAMLKLTSQPTDSVTVNLYAGGHTLYSSAVNFTTANWDDRQFVGVAGLEALLNGDDTADIITTLDMTVTSSDSDYSFSASAEIHDFSDTVKVHVDEGGTTQAILPTVSIRPTNDATEGDTQPGVFTVSSDIAAPAQGLRVFYTLNEGAASEGTEYQALADTTRGQWIHLDGVDDYVEIPSTTSLDFDTDDDFTVASWIRADPTQPDQTGTWNSIIEKRGASDTSWPFVIRYWNQTGRVYASRKDGATQPGLSSTTSINDGEFHHVAYVKSGSVLSLYIDGQLESSREDTTTNSTTNSSSLFFGRQGYQNRYFKGGLDEVQIWNRPLDESEIQQRAAESLAGNESGLVGYWNFDDAFVSDTTIQEVSGNSADGALSGGDSSNFVLRYVDIPAGEVSATILINAIDDTIADGAVLVGIDLDANPNYTVDGDFAGAQLDVLDEDIASIETARLVNIGSLDTTFEDSVVVDDLFDIEVTEFTETVTGTTVTIRVALKQAPSTNVALAIGDANGAATSVLNFAPGAFDTAQTAELTLVQAADTGLDLVATTDANGDGAYDSLDIDLPFRRLDVPFDSLTSLATSEDGENFSFGVRLTSQPTDTVTVDLGSQNTSEGLLDTSLNFDSTNWNVYQVVTVTAVDDVFEDGDQTYGISVEGSSVDTQYDPLSAPFFLTNEDNESDVDTAVDTSNDSDIIASIAPVFHTAGESEGPGQFQISLSEPAPAGGLAVGYVIFEGSATAADIDVPEFIERFADENPLAASYIDQTNSLIGASSLSMGDLDNDGDLDALLGLTSGVSRYFENVGSATVADFQENLTANPLGSVTGEGSALGDVDGDGDLDVIQVTAFDGSIAYFENQLIDTGSLSFIQRTGVANPFSAITLSDAGTPTLVDLDDDGTLELFVAHDSSAGVDLYESQAGFYQFVADNAVESAATGYLDALNFADWDGDQDQDVFIGSGVGVRYLENVGSAASAQFVERTGALNPADGITGVDLKPSLVDINESGSFDLFVTNSTLSGILEVRYFEAAGYQEVFIAEGETSLVVNVPVHDDVIDEADETLEVGLISRLTQSNNLVAADDFDDQFGLVVTGAYDGSVVTLQIDAATTQSIMGSTLAAGTLLTFTNGTIAQVDTDVWLDTVEGSTAVDVTLTQGTTIDVGERTTTTYDGEMTIEVTSDFDNIENQVGLQIAAFEIVDSFVLAAGTQLTFSGGVVATITEDTTIDAFQETPVPVTVPVPGVDSIAASETADLTVTVGEIPLLVNELDTDFLGVAAGTEIAFSSGSVFTVTTPELLTAVIPGDYNLDGMVDAADYTTWANNFGAAGVGGPGDGNFDGVVDLADYTTWESNFGTTDNVVVVAGILATGPATARRETATLVEPGYRTAADLTVTGDLSGGSVTLQINETAHPSFILPAGLELEFSGGATATVDADTLINNASGAAVAVTASSGSTILAGESSSTSDFFTAVNLEVTWDGESDGFITVRITDPGVTSFTIKAETQLVFSGGAILTVFGDVDVDNSEFGVQIMVDDEDSPVPVENVLAGETTQAIDFESVSSTALILGDDDEAGVTLTPSGATTTEAGATQTIDVVLDTEPTDTVYVYLGANANEAVLSDADETNQSYVQLPFTPLTWNVPQSVTVSGVDDDVDDGDASYTIHTTIVSKDVEYTDDTVPIVPVRDIDMAGSDLARWARFTIDDIIVRDTTIPQGTVLTFTNGAQIERVTYAGDGTTLKNTESAWMPYMLNAGVDTIGLNHTATVYDSFESSIAVTADYGAGSIGLQLISGDAISQLTLAAGTTLTFSNGAEATLDFDVSLNTASETIAAVSLISGTTITTDETTVFEQGVMDVMTAYNSGARTIGLQLVSGGSVKSVTLYSGKTLLFSNGAVATLSYNSAFNDTTETNAKIYLSLGTEVPATETGFFEQNATVTADERTEIDVTTAYDSVSGTISLQLASGEGISAVTLAAGKTLIFSNGAVATIDADVTLNDTTETTVAITLTQGSAIPATETTSFEENLIVTEAYDGVASIDLRVDDPLISSITFVAGTKLSFSNGAVAALDNQETFTNGADTTAAVTIDPLTITSKATTYFEEQLVADLTFSNTDDDGAGVTVFETDHAIAIMEGFSNNFFSVALDSEPVDTVEITLSPSDDNIRLESEFMGEPLEIYFDAANWDIAQTIEVTAVDDTLLEYDHSSSISFAVATTDTVYSGVSLPNDVRVFIEDDELPCASVVTVAGAIEANAPGYFVVMLDTPAPTGFGDTGIVVTYSIGGTADAVGASETADVQPITGTARIAPGETRSQLIAFPIDDFKTEGIDLKVTSDYDNTTDSTITLAINVDPFVVGTDGDASDGAIDLLLDSATSGETTILAQGTTLIFEGSTTATVDQTVIIKEDAVTSVPITLAGLPSDVASGNSVYQQVSLPVGTELKFGGGAVVTTTATTTVSNEAAGTPIAASLTQGASLNLIGDAADSITTLQGESVTVTITQLLSGGDEEYLIGDASTASLTILDNDRPGIRISEIGGSTTVIEGEGGVEFFVSLLSQPEAEVTITLTNTPPFREIVADGAYTDGETLIGLQINDPEVTSLLLSAGDQLEFGSTTIATVAADTAIFSGEVTDVLVTLEGDITAADLNANHSYSELTFADGSDSLTFDSTNWFQLQTVTVLGLDDNVVETGDFHVSDVHYTVSSVDPNYSGLAAPDQSINIVDRRFDVENTYQALAQGFLALQDSIDNITLPIIGDFGSVAPPFIENFLEDLVTEIRTTDNLTTEGLADALNTAIGAAIGGGPVTFTVTGMSSEGISFLLSFSDSLTASVALNSDLGLKALNIGIESEGELDLNVTYDVSLGFGINTTDGFYIDIDETGFDVAASLALSDDFSATGELGFLQLDIANGDTPGTNIAATFEVKLQDANDTNGNDTQLTLSEIVSARGGADPFSFISYAFTGAAALDLDITTSVGGAASFPSFGFNLYSDLPLFNYGNQAEAGSAGGAFDLAFNDITLDLGAFVTDLLGPIISSVNDVIKPMQPLIDVLTSNVKLLKKIGLADMFDQDGDGNATLIEVALTLSGGFKNGDTAAKFTKFVNMVTTVIELTESLADLEDSIANGDNLALDFGSYALSDFKGASATEDAKSVDPGANGDASALSGDGSAQTTSSGNNKVGNFFGKLKDLGITLDVIENPLNVIKLFLGQDIDLVTWDVPELDLGFAIDLQYPVFSGVKGILAGDFNVYSDLVFGFDTVGLSQWKDSDFAIEDAYLVFDGFYLSDVDPKTGADVDELTLDATIAAGVEANAVVAKVTAKGGVTGTAGLDMVDVGEYTGESDGKIRGSEIISRISRPQELFELAGSVDAFLNIAIKVGIDMGFWSKWKTIYKKELARVTLFEFSIGGGGQKNAAASAASESLVMAPALQSEGDVSASMAAEPLIVAPVMEPEGDATASISDESLLAPPATALADGFSLSGEPSLNVTAEHLGSGFIQYTLQVDNDLGGNVYAQISATSDTGAIHQVAGASDVDFLTDANAADAGDTVYQAGGGKAADSWFNDVDFDPEYHGPSFSGAQGGAVGSNLYQFSGGAFGLAVGDPNLTVLGQIVIYDASAASLPLGSVPVVATGAAQFNIVNSSADPFQNSLIAADGQTFQITGSFAMAGWPTGIALSNTSVQENEPTGASVGTLSTVDPDAGDSFTYSLVAGSGDSGNDSFAIIDDQLQTAVALDFEAQSSYSIRVRSTDTGGLWTEEVFTISVTDVNDPPELATIGSQSVNEQATLTFTANATDQDLPDDTLAFSLDAASLAAGMTINEATGEFSWTPSESQGGATYSVTITVTDDGVPLSADSETITVTVMAPPTVVGVFFRGDAWRSAFLDELDAQGHGHATIPLLGFANPVGDGSQLDVMPWSNVNQISVVFDQETIVEADDLTVLGVNTSTYALDDSAFSYDPVTYTATWSLVASLSADKLLLLLDSDSTSGVRSPSGVALDGEWANPADTTSTIGDTFPSGDGAAGGDFAFRANMHPGNVNGDERVTFSDFFTIRARLGQSPGKSGYNVIHDLNGDARITFSDAFLSRARLGLRLPTGEPSQPPAPWAPPMAAEVFDEEAAAFDMALLSWVDLDSSDEDDSDILAQTIADDLALMLLE